MNAAMKFQLRFVDMISNRIQGNVTLPITLSELLNVQVDSIYRRMRADQLFTNKELKLLASHFDIDMEEVKKMDESSTVFYGG